VRVKGEERVLRETFGVEWEDWHSKTARFFPGLI
jgi:protein-S-isoprenylcysteine O-methyltransferase Ste14